MIGGNIPHLGEDFLTRHRPVPVNTAADFRLHELFFSRTDPRGIIRSGNAVFTRVSGYKQEELLSHPHNVIRHPDMPRAIFELFWEYLKAQRPICAYVKNLAKDGCYYWVYAAAYPVEGGYLSVRLKPTSELANQIQTLYAKLLSIEVELSVSAARAELKQSLSRLGFDDYEHFMTQALFNEIQSRKEGLNRDGAAKNLLTQTENIFLAALCRESATLGRYSSALFDNLIQVVDNSTAMTSCSHKILGLFSRLKLLSLNMTIAAEKLGLGSHTLVVVAESFQEFAHSIKNSVEELEASLKPLRAAIRDAEFKCSSSLLQAEMMSLFSGELTDMNSSEERLNFVINNNHLFRLIQSSSIEVADSLKRLVDTMSDFEEYSTALNSVISSLEVIRIRGTMEAVQLPNGAEFISHIHSMQEFIQTIRASLIVLIDNARASRLSARRGQEILVRMFDQLAHLKRELEILERESP